MRSLVVETVADLVSDHRADAAVVRGVLGIRVEERRLQNRGREHDHVHGRLIVGVHRLRIHQPFVLVDRLADLGKLVSGLVQIGRAHVPREARVLTHVQCGIVAPMVGVADLRRELRKLLQSLRLGLLAQPGGAGDGDAVGVDEIAHQLLHATLGGLGEVAPHVFAAHVLAADAVDQRHAALPAVALLLLAGEHLAVEVEVRLVEFVRQLQRGADDDVHARP